MAETEDWDEGVIYYLKWLIPFLEPVEKPVDEKRLSEYTDEELLNHADSTYDWLSAEEYVDHPTGQAILTTYKLYREELKRRREENHNRWIKIATWVIALATVVNVVIAWFDYYYPT